MKGNVYVGLLIRSKEQITARIDGRTHGRRGRVGNGEAVVVGGEAGGGVEAFGTLCVNGSGFSHSGGPGVRGDKVQKGHHAVHAYGEVEGCGAGDGDLLGGAKSFTGAVAGIAGRCRAGEREDISVKVSTAHNYQGVGALGEGTGESAEGVSRFGFELGGLTDLRVAVEDSQGERLHFCVVAGLDDRFGGKVLHGDGKFAHAYGDRREAVGTSFLDVAAGRCERHKGEERDYFKHKIKILKG